jgi:glyoxylase-like metal-dependent hydrolase (beta-lactamase superfamily II)
VAPEPARIAVTDDRLYFRQLLAGRDFAKADPVARTMENFVYLVGDRQTGDCLAVDPAWDVAGLVEVAGTDGMRIAGALVTHWHPDHVGGSMMGHDVRGLADLLALAPGRIHVHAADVEWVCLMTGLGPADLTPVQSGDKVAVGAIEVECLHTPGHTKGSQCFRCGKALISGDTLFAEGCGRTDLPGGDVEEMWRTLYERLLALPSDLVLYPGHDYGHTPPAPLDAVRRTNSVLRAPDRSTFLRMWGR